MKKDNFHRSIPENIIDKIDLKIDFFIKKLFGFCPHHGWFLWPKKYRRNTAYVEDSGNWGYACEHCQKEDYEAMQELWDDYYSSRF